MSLASALWYYHDRNLSIILMRFCLSAREREQPQPAPPKDNKPLLSSVETWCTVAQHNVHLRANKRSGCRVLTESWPSSSGVSRCLWSGVGTHGNPTPYRTLVCSCPNVAILSEPAQGRRAWCRWVQESHHTPSHHSFTEPCPCGGACGILIVAKKSSGSVVFKARFWRRSVGIATVVEEPV